MSWTETTIRMNRNDTLAVMIDSVNYRNLLRLCVAGFPFSVSILSGCFDSLLSPTSSIVLLAFLIIQIALFIKKKGCTRNKVVLSPMAIKVIVSVRGECSDVSEVSINYVSRLRVH